MRTPLSRSGEHCQPQVADCPARFTRYTYPYYSPVLHLPVLLVVVVVVVVGGVMAVLGVMVGGVVMVVVGVGVVGVVGVGVVVVVVRSGLCMMIMWAKGRESCGLQPQGSSICHTACSPKP